MGCAAGKQNFSNLRESQNSSKASPRLVGTGSRPREAREGATMRLPTDRRIKK